MSPISQDVSVLPFLPGAASLATSGPGWLSSAFFHHPHHMQLYSHRLIWLFLPFSSLPPSSLVPSSLPLFLFVCFMKQGMMQTTFFHPVSASQALWLQMWADWLAHFLAVSSTSLRRGGTELCSCCSFCPEHLPMDSAGVVAQMSPHQRCRFF